MAIKPVDKAGFWRRRLNTTLAEGKPLFTAIYDTSIEEWDRIQRESGVIVNSLIKPGQSMMDAGCGYGALYELLPPGIAYTGIDISPDLIEIARLKYPDGFFTVGDLNRLESYRDDEMDWVVLRSIRNMTVENLGSSAWERIRDQLSRISHKMLIMDYDNPVSYHIISKE